MKWPIAILVLGFIASESIAADDDSKVDMQKLEGTWEVVSIEASGVKVDAGRGVPDKAVIGDGKATFFTEGKEIPTFKDLKLELDPTKSPKAVDLVRGEKESLPCIYEVTADALKLALPLAPKQRKPGEPLSRPESFETKDKPFMILTAKRSNGSTGAEPLTPGAYTCAPFSIIVVVPASMDRGMVARPDKVPAMPIIRPPLALVPLQH